MNSNTHIFVTHYQYFQERADTMVKKKVNFVKVFKIERECILLYTYK